MGLKFNSQPYQGPTGNYLSPCLTATLTPDRRGGVLDGTYSATASCVESNGHPTKSILSGERNATGKCDGSGTEVTFTWDWLSIAKRGVYRFHITVLEYVPEQSMFVTKATAVSDPINICKN
jgi:hypothetical protein